MVLIMQGIYNVLNSWLKEVKSLEAVCVCVLLCLH